jgi:hypothetical protein
MKLAFVTPDGIANCLLCRWQEKPPLFHSVLIDGKRKKEELTREKKVELAQQSLIVHLRDAHARLMLEKQEQQLGEEGTKIEFHGRADIRCWGPMRRY